MVRGHALLLHPPALPRTLRTGSKQLLKCLVPLFSDEKLDLNDSKWEDIHVITGALKMFFRELPEPLFTFNHFNDFVNAISKYVVYSVPPPRLNTENHFTN